MRHDPDLQGELFSQPAKPAPPAPEGLRYWPDVVTAEEEAGLAARLAELPFKPYEFRGYLGNRRTVAFGLRYDDDRHALEDAAAPPEFLAELRDRVAGLAGLPPGDFAHVLINEYAPGAGIGWHRDRPRFEFVAGVSLLTPCVMRFRRKTGERWERAFAPLAPRSAYLLSGPARNEWQHSITPLETLRYSITFRTLAGVDEGLSGVTPPLRRV
jgi:alkylated DNA repair dioxygenase AlkB